MFGFRRGDFECPCAGRRRWGRETRKPPHDSGHADGKAGAGGDSGTEGGQDTCLGITCNTPPPNECSDADNLRVYSSPGTCSKGQCSYASSLLACAGGCASDHCVDDPCAGMTCNTPPGNSCADPNTLKVYSSNGTCDGGTCSYASTSQNCPEGCAGGACNNDPCAGMTCNAPPANSCEDPNTLKVYSPDGTCSNGACSYASTTQNCPDGCAGGACTNDPCAGMTCNTPPANSCDGPDNLKVYSPTGTCSNGTCSYASTTQNCPDGCAGGTCNNDPCAGMTCNTPPANSCQDPNTLEVYSPSGHLQQGRLLVCVGDADLQCGLLEWHLQSGPLRRHDVQYAAGHYL